MNSIPSLNECLDKDGFQKDVNNLAQEELHKIENQIAEDILWTYSRKKYDYQETRNTYFKERIKSSAEKIKHTD